MDPCKLLHHLFKEIAQESKQKSRCVGCGGTCMRSSVSLDTIFDALYLVLHYKGCLNFFCGEIITVFYHN